MTLRAPRRGIRKGRRRLIIAPLITLTMLAAACSSDKDSSATTAASAPATTIAANTTAAAATTTAGSATPTTSGGGASTPGSNPAAPAAALGPRPTLPSGQTPKAGGDLTWLLSSEATAIDPKFAFSSLSTYGPMFAAAYDSLTGFDPKTGTVYARQAESVTGNDDSTEWTIKLRPGLKFSDGTPFDAAAIKANWDRLADPATAAPAQSTLKSFTGWEVVDDTTFKVTIPYSRAAFPYDLASTGLGFIASPAALQKFGADYGSSPESTVGAGPYTLTEWARGDHSTWKKNPSYWDSGRPYADQITMKPVTDPTTKLDAITTGAADLGFFPANNSITQQGIQDGLTSTGVLQSGSIAVVFNVAKAPYDDPRVREALTLATNAQDVLNKAAGGVPKPTTTWFPDTSPYYDSSLTLNTDDMAKAQQLIDEYVAEKGEINSNILVPQALNDLGVATLQNWNRLKGVNIVADTQDPTQSASNGAKGNYNAYLAASPNLEDIEGARSLLYSTSTGNVIGYKNADVDALFDTARGQAVPQRVSTVGEIARHLIDDAVYVPLYYNFNQTLLRKGLGASEQFSYSHPQPAGIWIN